MSKLIYIINMSLNGYAADSDGSYNWTDPSEEVFLFITNLLRGMSAHLYGRRMYETMMVWETEPKWAAESAQMADFAQVWQAAEKIVYSTTLKSASTRKTRIERSFDPEAIRQIKNSADHDLMIGGPDLARQAFRAGLIDECLIFLYPIIIKGGKSALPDDMLLKLELLEEHHFDNGTVFLRYRCG